MYGDVFGLSTEFADGPAVNGTANSSDFACYDAPPIMEEGPRNSVEHRRSEVVAALRPRRRLMVALSGGVDSAALLALAVDALGAPNVMAVTGRSEAVTPEEVDDARRVAGVLGVRHRIVTTREMARAGYVANAGDRCFHCRTELFEILADLARSEQIPWIAYGAIVDDLGDDRPGMEAARRLGILAPLLDAGISKSDARTLAKASGLHVSDKPASPCLASRIPRGTEVTAERLGQVAAAEAALRALGFRELRVRHHGEIARLELGQEETRRLASEALRARAVEGVRKAGFLTVVVDPEGYRTPGSRLYSIRPSRDGGQ